MSSLTSRSFLRLHPGLAEDELEYPVYARVTIVSSEGVRADGMHDAAGKQWLLSVDDTRVCVVSAQEARRTSYRSLLCRAVMTTCEERFQHAQVIATGENEITIALGEEQKRVDYAPVVPVAPIVALLLGSAVFDAKNWSDVEVVTVHHKLLGRILGVDQGHGTLEIPRVLDGEVEAVNQLGRGALMHWTEPQTGTSYQFELQHAVGYTYFVNGNVLPVPAHVGTSFCQQPRIATTPANMNRRFPRTKTRNPATSLFDSLVDGDDDEEEDKSIGDATASASSFLPSSQKCNRYMHDMAENLTESKRTRPTRAHTTTNREQNGRIIAKLMNDPCYWSVLSP